MGRMFIKLIFRKAVNQLLFLSITITSFLFTFPKNLAGNLNFSNASLGNFYPGGVNATIVQQLNHMFKKCSKPHVSRICQNRTKNLVRKFGTVTVNLNSGVSFNLSTFRRKILDKAAEVMHTDISKFDLDNSFQIDKVTYSIDYDKNAMTNIIDSKEDIKPQLDKF